MAEEKKRDDMNSKNGLAARRDLLYDMKAEHYDYKQCICLRVSDHTYIPPEDAKC